MRRSAPAGWEQTILLCTLIGTAQMTWGVVVPVLPLHMSALHAPVILLGPLIAAFAIGRVIGNIPAGLLMRRWNPRLMLHVCLGLLAAITAVTGLVDDLGVIFALRLAAGVLGGAAVTIAFAVVLAGAPAARRGRVVAVANVVQMSAAAVGALLGGVVVSIAGSAAAFIAAAVPVVLAAAWELVRPARGYWDAVVRPVPGGDDPAPVVADDSPRRGVLISLIAVSFALFFARFAAEQGLVPVLAYEQGGLDPVGLGLALAGGTMLSMLALPFVGRAIDRGARLTVILPSTLASAFCLVALGIADSAWPFALLVVAYGLMTSVANVVPGVVTAEAFPGRRAGGVVGVTRTAGDLGAAAGPVLVFALADGAGPTVALAGVAVVLVLALGPFAAVTHRWTRLRTARGVIENGG
ncbi:MFS transporter [Agromyces atrinae]|uniref:MFS family permease n=1 Tax=Agromyces atrinae TaxID=592376 RepID=A0A4Q2M663_9MICO|nr:MFS transporter [Agromyces atrinae]NYD65550.1 MFS family permease [Agromyces atrinae]RXZ85723.1 MFS transporter [Agromyces atrinae]